MNKYKVSWYDETENVWKCEIVEARCYDDAIKIVKNMGYTRYFISDIIHASNERKIKMTNKEYIEKNNISFSDAMKMYDNEKYSCIDDWLNQEYQEHKFKVGDFVTVNGNNDGIGVVIDVKDMVYYKFLKRSGEFCKFDFEGSGMYYKYEADVCYMIDESKYQKIF